MDLGFEEEFQQPEKLRASILALGMMQTAIVKGKRSAYKFTHNENPHITYSVKYTPGESDNDMFGGNSNWWGPIWLPMNYLVIESLRCCHLFFGDDFTVECPTGSGTYLTLNQVADELSRCLLRIFERNEEGIRPVFGNSEKMQRDEHFKDCLLFYEYFHGKTGKGLGASHQTGWTALVAALSHPYPAKVSKNPHANPSHVEPFEEQKQST